MTAILLGAGVGSRIREYHNLPKGLIQLGEKTIIEDSLAKLNAVGITRVCLVTGYKEADYRKVLSAHSNVEYIHNPKFESTGSLLSLITGLQTMDEDVVILEADIIYEIRGLVAIQNANSNAILVSGFTKATDEVFAYTTSGNMRLERLEKTVHAQGALGEFVGITKLSREACKALVEESSTMLKTKPQASYDTDGINWLASQENIECCLIEDLVWSEIDDLNHLSRAKKIYSQTTLPM